MKNKEKTKAAKNKNGVSIKVIVLPFVALILLLHFVIIWNSARIDRMGQSVTDATELMFTYSRMSNECSKGVAALAKQARQCVCGTDESSVSNYLGSLAGVEGLALALESSMTQRGFDDAAEKMMDSIDAMRERFKTEKYAIRLAAETWSEGLSESSPLQEVVLKDEDLALSESGKIGEALMILSRAEYLSGLDNMERDMQIAVNMATEDTKSFIKEESKVLSRSRMVQTVLTVCLLITIVLFCICLIVMMLRPLERGVLLVQQGKPVSTEKGFQELRRLAVSYNELLDSRKALEEFLRAQSHTDALTGLPNRLALQEYIEALERDFPDSPVTVYSMDVNFLKKTNDQKGHTFGDMLLRNSADCIRTVFDDGTHGNCFRFGGDEFAAIRCGDREETIQEILTHFREEQVWRRISISIGYAHAQRLGDTSVRQLFGIADRNMYEDKTASRG